MSKLASHLPRVMVIGLVEGGENSIVLQLFPSAISRLHLAVDWAKAHPDAEHVEVILHGEKPDALIMALSRTALFSLMSELTCDPESMSLQ